MDALKNNSLEDLQAIRREIWDVYDDRTTPDHVKQGAAALINYYGAEIDMRLMKGYEK
jgi:hypothetical protein